MIIPDNASMKSAIHNSDLCDTLKAVLKKLELVQRHCPGTDGYRLHMRNELFAMSMYCACPLAFLTINPADVKHRLTLVYSVDGKHIVSGGEDGTAEDRAPLPTEGRACVSSSQPVEAPQRA